MVRSTKGEWAKDLDKLPETTEFKHTYKNIWVINEVQFLLNPCRPLFPVIGQLAQQVKALFPKLMT